MLGWVSWGASETPPLGCPGLAAVAPWFQCQGLQAGGGLGGLGSSQANRGRLLASKGDSFLPLSHGLPWGGEHFGEACTLAGSPRR